MTTPRNQTMAAPLGTGQFGPLLRYGALAALVVLLGIFPLAVTDSFTMQIAVYTMIAVVTVVAWNLFSGYSGYISLGHAVFFGSGAYAAGLIAQEWKIPGSGVVFLLLVPAGIVAALIAVPFGLVALRVRRHTFIVITIAVFFIFQLMAYNLWFTHGTIGMNAPFLLWNQQTIDARFYYMAFGLAAVTTMLSWFVYGSRFGLQLRAIRDDEDRARGLGVRPMRVKLSAFMVSAFFTGTAGALWFFFLGQVQPNSGYDPLLDLKWALMAFFGGLGTVAGPVLGALVIAPLDTYLTSTFSSGWLGEVLFGVIFLAVVLLMPRGALPTGATAFGNWQARRRQAQDGQPAGPPGSARGLTPGELPSASAAEPGASS